MQFRSLVLFGLNVLLSNAKTPTNPLICNGKVIARLPTKDGPPPSDFRDTPRGYFAGQWYTTYRSVNDSVPSLELKNIQFNSVYDVEKDITQDLTTYQIQGCNHIYSIYATDKDRKNNDDFPLYEPGNNITRHNDIIAYGFDTDCSRYFVVYGRAPSVPGIVIDSSISTGPSKRTFKAIKAALIGLGNANITALAKSLKQLPRDGARTGLPDYICDQNCLVNQNSPTGSCPSY